ncbi:phytanoyl-CoA dioxygenase family protein [Roseobacter sp. EG26]|uniref:phytanoyl-CoA dioxygenase family protein n=1 Tax=Roseobacter sp. EG26 TaxID=3412477 RepID=UPI003CE4AA55
MTFRDTRKLTLNGQPVPDERVGSLTEADASGDLFAQLARDGYLLLRGAHDATEVDTARLEVLYRLAEVGEVAEPTEDGIASGRSHRRDIYPNTVELGAFWQSVSEGPALRAVINGPSIAKIMDRLFGEKSQHFSFAWLRAMTAGRASPLHVDHPYMNRGSKRLVTCWTPLCDISLADGPLYILEGSHRWNDIRQQFEGHDVDQDTTRPGHIEQSAIALAQRKNSRFLTTEFKPGDCLVFGMFTAHGSFDNASQTGRIRLSCDTRFQPAADPMDHRFSGSSPAAHNGLGYGCLSAALPMTETGKLR